MHIFIDRFTGAEMFSDVCRMKLVDDFYYVVECQKSASQQLQVNTGANKSAEEQDDTPEDEMLQGTITQEEKAVPTGFQNKKELMTYYKSYFKFLLKALKKEHDDEYINAFQEKSKNFVKFVADQFKDWDFFFGEQDDSQTQTQSDSEDEVVPMLILKNFREGENDPYYIYLKDGLICEKC